MKNHFLLFILLIIHSTSISQVNNNSKKKNIINGIEINFGAGLTKGSNIMDNYFFLAPYNRLPTLGWETGISIFHQLNDKFYLKLGIIYSKYCQNYEMYESKEPYYWNRERNISLNYIKIPFSSQYFININKEWKIITTLGFYFSLLVDYLDHETIIYEIGAGESTIEYLTEKKNVKYIYHGGEFHTAMGTTYTTSDYSVENNLNEHPFNKYDLGGIFSIGVSKNLFKKIDTFFSLTFQHSFQSILNYDCKNYWGYFGPKGKRDYYYNSSIIFQTGIIYNF